MQTGRQGDSSKSTLQRRDFLKMIALASGLGGGPLVASDSPKRPNALFISVDDLNPSLGCYGNKVVRTPNIDKLAARGVHFYRCYAQYASCAPSRFSFLSGWHVEKTGVCTFGPKSRDGALRDAIYLPQHFRNHGYTSMRLDKIFHIGKDDPASWDVTEEPYRDKSGQFKAIWTGIEVETLGLTPRVLQEGRQDKVRGEKGPYAVLDVKDEELFDGRTATRAVELLEERARDRKPFFLAVGFRRPHLPWIAPKKYFDMYKPEDMPLPPKNPKAVESRISPREHQEMIAHYYACVSYMDAQVGRVLDALERTELAQDTIVVLFGDQGYCLGERDDHFGKGNLWEWSLIVPLIVALPRMRRQGKQCDRVVQLLDMYPTLVELCGLPRPAGRLQGRSLAPLLNDVDVSWNDCAISAWGLKDGERPGLSVRTARYRYTESADRKPVELIDYETDPHEWDNLVNDPKHADIREQLRRILDQDRS